MIDRAAAAIVLCVLGAAYVVGVWLCDRYSTRARLERAYWRAITDHGPDSEKTRAARDALMAHWMR